MNARDLAPVLIAVLGGGGITGLLALFRMRTDKDSTVVDTVGKGLMVMERLNDRLEEDLADERRARIAAEAEVERLRRELLQYRGGNL